MSGAITSYRVTPDDLGVDSKTAEGLQALLDSLNITLPQLTQAVEQQPESAVVPVSLTTDVTVADSFPILFRNPLSTAPTYIAVCCRPKDPSHDLTVPFVAQGFEVTSRGLISIPWVTGLLASQSYALSFYVR